MQKVRTLAQVTALLALGQGASALCALAQEPSCSGLQPIFGGCASAGLVARSEARSIKLSTGQTSYIGSPFGDVRGGPIPHHRFYRDNTIVHGLQTFTTVTTTVISTPYTRTITTYKRSK
jgi:hypothetical protein